jgi:hypothetical protein
MQCLARYRYLRSTYLHAFTGGASEKRFLERLCELFHQGYVARPAQQWQYAQARCQPIVYEAGPRRRHGLTGDVNLTARTFLSSGAHRQFGHALAICECLASIELATAAHGRVRFIPWPEVLARAPEAARRSAAPFRLCAGDAAVIPDGLFGIEYQMGERKTYRFFALEVDRGTMPVARRGDSASSVAGKLAVYAQLIAGQAPRRLLGIPNLFVLIITSSEARAANLCASASGSQQAPWLLFRAAEWSALRWPSPALLSGEWSRPGLPPLCIAEPV